MMMHDVPAHRLMVPTAIVRTGQFREHNIMERLPKSRATHPQREPTVPLSVSIWLHDQHGCRPVLHALPKKVTGT